LNWVTGIRILGNLACLFALFYGYMFCSQCSSYLIIFMTIKVLKRFEFSLRVFCESSTRYPSISHLKKGRAFYIDDQICPNS